MHFSFSLCWDFSQPMRPEIFGQTKTHFQGS
nr:MAG TPA: Putative membrane transport protein.1, ZntB, cytoplasmic domain, Vibrio [Caudoviricetes sp.]DAY69759.1 MAG TPA: Putative membrane transport protein.1, ZntB, cytoplasmic domain, Vibrio [Caudoviricetes sp.]